MDPYFSDGQVSLYLGDCLEYLPLLDRGHVLVTDPPYGRKWRAGDIKPRHCKSDAHAGIIGDESTEARDHVLSWWGNRPAIVFGDLMLAPPANTKQVLVYHKPPGSGIRGAIGGFRRDAEAIYLVGKWPSGLGGRSSVLTTMTPTSGGLHSPAGRYGHPHTKPLDLMEQLITYCPPGVIVDPFAGSGSTLVAARNLGRNVIGFEIDERYAKPAARRLAQGCLDLTADTQS